MTESECEKIKYFSKVHQIALFSHSTVALGQIIIEPDQPVNCTGDFVKERCSNECDRPSCYDLAFGPSICPMYCTEFCVCKDGMVFDDCERDCRLPKDCSSAERTYACVFPDEVDGDSTDGANPAVDGTPGDV